MHVTSAIDNQINSDFSVGDTVDEAVRFEEGLPVFFDTKAEQFFWVATAFRESRQAFHNVYQCIQHIVGARDAVELTDVVVNGLQILLRTLGEEDFKLGRFACHQSQARLARRRVTTSAAGLTLPAATS